MGEGEIPGYNFPPGLIKANFSLPGKFVLIYQCIIKLANIPSSARSLLLALLSCNFKTLHITSNQKVVLKVISACLSNWNIDVVSLKFIATERVYLHEWLINFLCIHYNQTMDVKHRQKAVIEFLVKEGCTVQFYTPMVGSETCMGRQYCTCLLYTSRCV